MIVSRITAGWRTWVFAQNAAIAGRLASLRAAMRATQSDEPEPWSDPRVVALLTRLRAAESFLQDPLLGDAVGAIEWLMGREMRR